MPTVLQSLRCWLSLSAGLRPLLFTRHLLKFKQRFHFYIIYVNPTRVEVCNKNRAIFCLKRQLAFCATLSLSRQDPDELQEIFSNEYNRRGRPVEHTQWDPDTVRRYMRYRLSKLRVGQNCGCYKHNLPAAGADNTPAPLPAEVIAWEKSSEGVPKKSSKVTAHEPLDGEDIRDPEEKYLSDAAYELDLDKETKCYTLRHCETGDEVVLDDLPPGGKYQIYKTETGLTCLWAGVDSRPEYACDVFLQAAFETSQPQADNKTKKRGITGVTAGAAPMAGMAAGEGAD